MYKNTYRNNNYQIQEREGRMEGERQYIRVLIIWKILKLVDQTT